MNDQQPPAYPPPPGPPQWGPPPGGGQPPYGAPPQGYAPVPSKPPLPGIAVVFLIFNILIALLCGFVDLGMVGFVEQMKTPEGREQITRGFEEIRDQQAQQGLSQQEREQFDRMAAEVEGFLQDVGERPGIVEGVRTAHLAEIAIKALLLLGSALLFARTRIGLQLTLLALVGWIAVNVYWAIEAGKLSESEPLQYSLIMMTGISVLYPLLALLVLGLSGGVRRACTPAPAYPQGPQGGW